MMAFQDFRALPRLTQAYVAVIVVAGAATVAQSVYDLSLNKIGWSWTVLALLTLVSGSATVRLASTPATISVSETFVFTSVLLFGPAAGTITVALDALVISLWSYARGNRLYKIVFNVCALPLTIWLAAHAFFLYPGVTPIARTTGPVVIQHLVVPLVLFTILYFSINSWIITFAIALERRLSPYRIWKDNFVWLSLNYFGGASVAILLVSYTRELDYTYLIVIVPLLIVLYFTFSTSMGRVADANRHLSELNSLYMSTIETLAMAIDAKDQITHGHIRRVQTFAVRLAHEVGVSDPSLIRAIEAAALLHDMGKLAVPEYILNKPGPLTAAEFEKMKLHASVGADILSSINFPYPVVPIVRHHHENWNGTGYPAGLAGTAIPIGARILSVVDCFDALTSDRPYRPRLSDKDALRILHDRRGTMYDPLIVDTFTRVLDKIVPEQAHPENISSLKPITDAIQSAEQPAARTNRLDQISASTEEMITLFELARGLSADMTLADVSDVIAKHLRRLVPCSACVFFLYDAEMDELLVAHAVGDNPGLLSGVRLALGERLSGWVAANRQTIRNSDPALDLGESARAVNPRLRSCLSTPLVLGEDLVGVLTLYSTGRDSFSEEHQRIIEVVAHQVAPIMRRSGEAARAKSASIRDAVTGLPTIEHLHRLTAAADPTRGLPTPTSVLILDVDNLRAINLSHGREAGDRVLSHVVSAARRVLRSGDLLFRYGSDEFVAVLMQTDNATARVLGEQILSEVGTQRVAEEPDFRVSIAIVTAPEDGRSVDDLISTGARRLNRPVRRTGENPPDGRHESIH